MCTLIHNPLTVLSLRCKISLTIISDFCHDICLCLCVYACYRSCFLLHRCVRVQCRSGVSCTTPSEVNLNIMYTHVCYRLCLSFTAPVYECVTDYVWVVQSQMWSALRDVGLCVHYRSCLSHTAPSEVHWMVYWCPLPTSPKITSSWSDSRHSPVAPPTSTTTQKCSDR